MVKVNAKSELKRLLKLNGYKLGCYDKKLNAIHSIRQIDFLIEKVAENNDCDVELFFNYEPHIVEIFHVDGEVDFIVQTKESYKEKYGREVSL